MKILIAETKDFSTATVAALSELGEVALRDIAADEVQEALNTYDVFWFRLGFKLTATLIESSTRCRYIVCPVTGLDHIDLEACKAKGITVLSLRGETEFLKKVRATAELTMGLTLALLRNIPQATHSVNGGVWNRDLFKGQELYEKKVGILGMGRLGSITAGYFSAFGCEVSGYDVKPFDTTYCRPCDSIEELFANNHIVSIHVNLVPETKNLVNYALLKQMQPGSFLVNTSRGAIVNSEDLLRALTEGIVAGAATDVIGNEFDHTNDPMIQYSRSHSNLLITPHIGGNTWESFAKTELFLARKLAAAVLA